MIECQYHILKDNKYIAICEQDYLGQPAEDMANNVLFYTNVDDGISALIAKVKEVIKLLSPYKKQLFVSNYISSLEFIFTSLDKTVKEVPELSTNKISYDF